MDSVDPIADINSRLRLAEFLDVLAGRVADAPDDFENVALPQYLSAAAAWVRDMDGYFASRGKPVPLEPSWALVAAIFDTAAVYE